MCIEELREKFKNDRFASEALGAVIDSVREGGSVVSAEITGIMQNAEGGLMGGAIFTLADFAFAVANYASDEKAVSLSSSITFLTTAKGKRLIAEATAIRRGRKTNCYRVDIHDELGNAIATATFNGYIVAKPQ